jgi:hypothetical protein
VTLNVRPTSSSARVLAVESVAQDQHLTLTHRKLVEDPLQRLAAKRGLGRLVGKRCRLVGDEVAEFRLFLVADRLLERDGSLRRAPDLLDLST